MTRLGAADDAATPASPLRSLSFEAFGRRFEIALASNDRLKGGLAPKRQAALSDVRLYRGTVNGIRDSWVRLAATPAGLSGLIFDGVETYVLEPSAAAGDGAGKPRDHDARPPDVYRLADATWPTRQRLYDEVVTDAGRAAAAEAGPAKLSAEPAELQSADHLPVDSGLRLDMGVVADREFVLARGDEAESDLMTIMNIVDGIYISQLGIQLRVTELELFPEEPDPFTSDDGQVLLGELEDYKAGTEPMRAAGLAHLFTGRELESSGVSDYRQVGIANLGVLCSAEHGAALTATTRNDHENALIAAHEIGHNFGAPHDGQVGSACESAPFGGLMSGEITGSEELSECSIEHMLAEIEAAECLEPLEPNDLSLRVVDATDPLEYGETGFVTIAVDGNGLVDGAAVQLSFEAAGSVSMRRVTNRSEQPWECSSDDVPQCTMDYFPADSTAEFRVGLNGDTPGSGTVTARVETANDPNPDNNVLEYEATVREAADLESTVEVTSAPRVEWETVILRAGEQASFTATISNNGPGATAPDVESRLEFTFDEEFDITVVPGSGACEPDTEHSFRAIYDCGMGDIPAGEHRTIEITLGRTEAIKEEYGRVSGGFSIISTSSETDPNSWNNGAGYALLGANAVIELTAETDVPENIEVGSDVNVSVTVGNAGPDDAENIRIRVEGVGLGLSAPIEEASIEGGTCLLEESDWSFTCELDELAAGSNTVLNLRARAVEPGSRSGEIRLSSPDTNVGDRPATTFAVEIVDAPDPPADDGGDSGAGGGDGGSGNGGSDRGGSDSGGSDDTASGGGSGSSGGGGAVDRMALLMLMLALGMRWRAMKG